MQPHATSWEHAIELAARFGGDTDTIACMAGGIAEACFGLSASFGNSARRYLTKDMVQVVDASYGRIGRNPLSERPVASAADALTHPTGVIGFEASRDS